MIKASLPDVIYILNTSCDVVLQSGVYQNIWKTGINIPIYKSSDPKLQTLIISLGTLFNQILKGMDYLENKRASQYQKKTHPEQRNTFSF